jgi:hypothetical protein
MNIIHKLFATAFILLAAASASMANVVECLPGQPSGSVASRVTAVTDTSPIYITTKFIGSADPSTPDIHPPQLQLLLRTVVNNATAGCLVAHLSGLVMVSDNTVFFHVRVDGHPIAAGQSFLAATTPDVPVTFVSADANSDRHKVLSYNFFEKLPAVALNGRPHVIEVYGAAGLTASADYASNPSIVSNLVLTLEHP